MVQPRQMEYAQFLTVSNYVENSRIYHRQNIVCGMEVEGACIVKKLVGGKGRTTSTWTVLGIDVVTSPSLSYSMPLVFITCFSSFCPCICRVFASPVASVSFPCPSFVPLPCILPILAPPTFLCISLAPLHCGLPRTLAPCAVPSSLLFPSCPFYRVLLNPSPLALFPFLPTSCLSNQE